MKTAKMPARIEYAIKLVLVARNKWDAANRVDHETKCEILRDNIYMEQDSAERITEPNADFLMSDTDYENYCKQVYIRNCEKGFNSGSWDLNFWPIQNAVYKAEDALIDAIADDMPEITPEGIKIIKNSPEKRKQFFNIINL